jgi:hypothetical protein
LDWTNALHVSKRRTKFRVFDIKLSNQTNPEAMLMVKATKVVLKKKANTQCSKPVRRILRLAKLTSAVCPEVPITQAKYKKSP